MGDVVHVGLREANQRFATLIKAVLRGHEVVLTNRGRPFAKVTLMVSENGRENTLDRLAAAGLLRRATARAPRRPFKPRKLRTGSIVETLREERNAEYVAEACFDGRLRSRSDIVTSLHLTGLGHVMHVGLREANQRFSKIMKMVRRGQEVVLTERGKPIAKITRIAENDDLGLDAVIEQLAAAGKVIPAEKTGPMPRCKLFPATAESTTATLSKLRDER